MAAADVDAASSSKWQMDRENEWYECKWKWESKPLEICAFPCQPAVCVSFSSHHGTLKEHKIEGFAFGSGWHMA